MDDAPMALKNETVPKLDLGCKKMLGTAIYASAYPIKYDILIRFDEKCSDRNYNKKADS